MVSLPVEVVQIDVVDAQTLERLLASLLHVFGRAVENVTWHEAKLRSKEDLIPLSGLLEPDMTRSGNEIGPDEGMGTDHLPSRSSESP